MTLEIVPGESTKPAASGALVEALENVPSLAGLLFIGFPIIRTADGPQAVDALWISKEKGIVIFDLVQGADLGNYQDRQDDTFNAIESRLRLDRRLVARRQLRIPVNTVSFAPQCVDAQEDGYTIVGSVNVANELSALDPWRHSSEDIYKAALSTLKNVTTIRSGRGRTPSAPRATKLKELEENIATLDPWQNRALHARINGVQRIRGLAGSGKTIVLALKAAYLHILHPEWRIAITFNTRSLKDTFRTLVRDFYTRGAEQEPDWSCLEVMNAWGGRGGDGIYSAFCKRNDIDYLDYDSAKQRPGADPFAAACQKALADATNVRPVYDAILVDEAQDLPPSFLWLCYSSLNKPRRLVYAYDELQQLSGESLPSPETLFGKQKDGQPRVRLDPEHDIVLPTCYRNSRPILLTAHAIGFGIYRRPNQAKPRDLLGLVQMFDEAGLWHDVGYSTTKGSLEEGKRVVLRRDSSASPTFLEEHSSIDDLVQFHVFDNEDEQARWVVTEIERNLHQDGLRHDDIIVINPDPITTRRKVGTIRTRMLRRGIACHLAGVTASRDTFFATGPPSVTLSGVHRAKGNEAAMVYIVNAEAGVTETYNAAGVRNRLFAAITRSKAWVRVAGIGPAMEELKREYEKLKQNDFELRFRYPTADERAKIRTIHRDLSPQQQERHRRRNTHLKELLRDIQRGECSVEDIDPELRDQLTSILVENSDSASDTHAD